MPRWGHRRRLKLAVGAVAAALAAGALGAGLLGGPEAASVDARFSLRGERPAPDMLVVQIDDRTISELGERFPFRRSLHGRVIDRLRRAGARRVAYDVQFTEPTTDREDFALYDAVARKRGTVLSTTEVGARGRTAVLGGDAALAKAHARAANTLLPRQQGAVRRVPRSLDGLESFAVATAESVKGRQATREGFGSDGALIDFAGPPGTIDHVSFSDVLRGRVPARKIRGRTVVVGASAPSLQDVHPVPTSGDELMDGPELQANAISTVMRGLPLRDAPIALSLLALLALACVPPVASLRTSTPAVALGSLAALALYLSGSVLAFTQAGLVLLVAAPVCALALSLVGTITLDLTWANRDRSRARDLFSRFVPEPVVAELLDRTDGEPRLGGARMDATVMFADLRGFTTFSERLPAEDVIDVLNHYLSEMSEAVLDHGGTLVSYMGDGIMAVFGSPIERPDHADAAVAAAREMLGPRLATLNAWLEEDGHQGFRMGLGLNSGEVMSGNVGSERRLEYAAVGDTTNVAARLETATKEVEGGLLISDSTYSRLSPASREGLTPHGLLEVKGRAGAIATWALELPSAGEAVPAEADRPAPEHA